MKKFLLALTFNWFLSLALYHAQAQKTVSEGTLTYNISMVSSGAEASTALTGAGVMVYLKGALSRVDMVSSLGNEKTIYDSKSGTGVILKEYSGQKLMITLSRENWSAKNRKTEGVEFSTTSETKDILGYACNKATATLSDGAKLTVFYAKDLLLLNREYDGAFKSLQGVPMQYEVDNGKTKIVYSITKIDLNAVPVSRFEVPKTGYRVISYDDNQKGKQE